MNEQSEFIKADIDGSRATTELPRELRFCALSREQCVILLEGETVTNDNVVRDRASGFFWAFVIALGGLSMACDLRLPDESWNWPHVLVLFVFSVGLVVSLLEWCNAKRRIQMTSTRRSHSDVRDYVIRYYNLDETRE